MQQSDKTRTVIVTGGTRGIGLEIVKAFAEAGDFVVVGARENSSEIQALGERVRFVAMDVRREEDHMRLVAAAREWKSGPPSLGHRNKPKQAYCLLRAGTGIIADAGLLIQLAHGSLASRLGWVGGKVHINPKGAGNESGSE